MGWKAARSMKALKSSLADGKRKAVLQRRRLFDFVSPLLVFLAVASCALLVALVLYIRQHPFPGFDALPYLVVTSLLFGFFAFLVYGWLYGRNRVPLATHADRLLTIRVTVKTLLCTGIGFTVFSTLELTLSLLHLESWSLLAVTAAFLICMTFTSIGPRRQPTASTKHLEISLPVADLNRFVGRYDTGKGFAIAIARDGTTLWWLRLDIPGAQPVPTFPESPLVFFWKGFEQQICFTTDANGAVTAAQISHGTNVLTVNHVERTGSPPFGRAADWAAT